MKPDDIPEGVWQVAREAFAGHGRASEYDETLRVYELIARAILAERERCAEIAQRANEHYASCQSEAKKSKDRFKARDFESMRIAAGGLAAAIRGAA